MLDGLERLRADVMDAERERADSTKRLGPVTIGARPRMSCECAVRARSWGVRIAALIGLVLASSVIPVPDPGPAAAQNPPAWKRAWEVEDGFRLTIDSVGYSLPTSLAFVPNPGPRPSDPLYFVTELRGAVKVVTNDRTVHTFAEVETFRPRREAPALEGQAGLAGICLDPKHGYVFVTFAYPSSGGELRNNIVRFQTRPGVFSLGPTSRKAFTNIFARYKSGVAHQIGGCQVAHGTLFVGVGDGLDPTAAKRRDVLLGKIVRMTLDGEPIVDNPFSRRRERAARYVWAYGLRNPFGLKIVRGLLFATHNGPGVDSLLRIERGRDYLWDGTDESIGIGAEAVFSPSLSPVQLDHHPQASRLFPKQYRNSFFIAVAGHDPFRETPGPGAGIVVAPYDLARRRASAPPRYFLRFRGNGQQLVVGAAFGRDGLYFVPLLPDEDGRSYVIRVTFDPANEHEYILRRESRGEALIAQEGCLSCHQLYGSGGFVGPSLDQESLFNRLVQRLLSDAYRERVEALSDSSYRNERQAVLAADGNERLRIWIKTQILSPGFDNPSSQMPDLGLTDSQAESITDFLLPNQEADQEAARDLRGLADSVHRKLLGPPSPARTGLVGLVAGVILALMGIAVSRLALGRLRRPRGPGAA